MNRNLISSLEPNSNRSYKILGPQESSDLLSKYGIKCPDQKLALNEDEAAQFVAQMDSAAVLKIAGKNIAHKSDYGGVITGVDKNNVRSTYRKLMSQFKDDDSKGVLVQQFIRGTPELMLGGKRDDVFGVLLVFGIGGIWVEIYHDVSVCAYPCSDADLKRAVEEISGKRLLEGYRGAKPVSKSALLEMLRGLGELMLNNPTVREVDINPVIPDSTGLLLAADVKIALSEESKPLPEKTETSSSMTVAKNADILKLFEPQSVAVIGASNNSDKIAGMIIPHLIKFGFPRDKIFPVNPHQETISNITCYKSVKDIPSEIDQACIVVPPSEVATTLKESGLKGIKSAIIFSSGFQEIGRGEDQRNLSDIAKSFNMHFCGPNTEGIISPFNNNCSTFSPSLEYFSKLVPGESAIVAQSGGVMMSIVGSLFELGLGISRAVSSGNEADLDVSDYLEFYASDPKTKAVSVFMEGVRNGPKFIRAAKALATAHKPCIALKCGRSEKGAKAALLHTGAVAGSYETYKAIFRQFGILEADDIEEIVDYLAGFTLQPLPEGRRLVVISASGGANGLAADACADAGLTLPEISEPTRKLMRSILPEFGSVTNPLDITGQVLGNPQLFEKMLESLVDEGDIFLTIRVGGGIKGALSLVKCSELFRQKKKTLISCIMSSRQSAESARSLLLENKIPVFGTPLRSIRAISAMMKYKEFLDTHVSQI